MFNQGDMMRLVAAGLILILISACGAASSTVPATSASSLSSGVQPTNTEAGKISTGATVIPSQAAVVSVAGSVDACKLLTLQEIGTSLVETATNQDATPNPHQNSAILFTSCTYNLTNAANAIDGILSVDYWNPKTLALEYEGPVGYVTRIEGSDVKNNVDVPNLGDKAVWESQMGELFVAAKDTVLEFDFMAQNYSPKIKSSDLDMLKKLAAIAITHLS